ncbi:hypothetical protein BZB76_2078 [Actinomadura pelletieri DSM 43383]|uniref:Secreted protein n=1 Tax=Actinomadura pelletieri DSM 43383 TaxID=1120940 RepID=A0A495QT90_9ACTN|nr:hypothetical protein [Actinomadura pelletieri]RKS76720.1 hypothetical protein BZB76_2078 [Actinomadura pelletieri DSM 43383]
MKLARGTLVAFMAVPAIVAIPPTAHAETALGCGNKVQIGLTAHIRHDGQTFASVKQFSGCGKNWAYLYVWAGYRNSHRTWNACVAIADDTDRSLEGLQCRIGTKEIWSLGTDTLRHCTRAVGWIPDGPNAYSTRVC